MKNKWKYLQLILAVCLLLFPIVTAQAEDYTYAVPIETIGKMAFHREEANRPETMTLNTADNTLKFADYSYTISSSQIPTTKIQVSSANRVDGIRDIYVNTQLTITESSNDSHLTNRTLYLFYNKYGGISLAVPNVFGNVPSDQKEVMMEYFANEVEELPSYPSVPAKEATYRVDTTQLGSLDYSRPSINAPSDYQLNFNENTMTFAYLNSSETNIYKFQVIDIPTREIRVFSHNTNQVRKVSVNTMLVPTEIVRGNASSFGHPYYLFTNYNGSISLATYNFAGNVTEAYYDVMLEYVPAN